MSTGRPAPSLQERILDPRRLAAVRATGLLDSPSLTPLDQLAALAARLLGAPNAFVTLVDHERSFWTTCIGLPPGSPRQNTVEESFCQYVVQDAAPLLIGDTHLDERTRHNPSVVGMGVRAWAGVPLMSSDGQVLGSFCVVDGVAHTWTDDDAELLQVLAQAASGHVALLGLVDIEREAREQLRTLSDATALLLEDLEPTRLLSRLCSLAVPALASWCTAWLPAGEQLVAASVSGPEGDAPLWPAVEISGDSLSAKAFRAGEPQLLASLTEHLERYEPDAAITARSAAIRGGPAYSVPLVSRGQRLGAFTLVRGDDEPTFTDNELAFARELAQRTASALLLARQYDTQRETAEVLQRSMLPRPLALDGIEVHTLYRPAGGIAVGGDWFDAIDLGAGRYALVIGDVMGRGVQASAVMGQMRSALRAYARMEVPPGQLLGLLDDLALELEDGHIVTCFYGVLDLGSSTLTWSSAGHLPPMLRHGDTVVPLSGEVGAPLGCGPQLLPEVVSPIAPGDVLCLFTDGLAEDRHRDLDEGLGMIADALAAADQDRLADLAARLVAEVASEEEDDVAILLARLPLAAERGATFAVVGGASGVPNARHWASAVLRGWGASEDVEDSALLVISELVTNGLVHGVPPVTVRLRNNGRTLYIEVHDRGARLPQRRLHGADDEGGRGMDIVGQVAKRWGARLADHKVVWVEIDLSDP